MNTKIPRFHLSITAVLVLSSIHSAYAEIAPCGEMTATDKTCIVGSYDTVNKVTMTNKYLKDGEIKGTKDDHFIVYGTGNLNPNTWENDINTLGVNQGTLNYTVVDGGSIYVSGKLDGSRAGNIGETSVNNGVIFLTQLATATNTTMTGKSLMLVGRGPEMTIANPQDLDEPQSFNTVLHDQSREVISNKGTATGTKLYGESIQDVGYVWAGSEDLSSTHFGTAINTELYDNSHQNVYFLAENTTLKQNAAGDNAPTQSVFNGGTTNNTTVEAGVSIIAKGGKATGTMNVSGSGSIMLETSDDNALIAENITLNNSGNELVLYSTNAANNQATIGNLTNNGVTQFTEAVPRSNKGADSFSPVSLSVANLSGNGTYVMRANIGAGVGDYLQIKQLSEQSENKLFIANNGAAKAKDTDVLSMVTVENGTPEAKQFTLANTVEQGGYQYGLRQNGNEWELYALTDSPVDPGGNGGGTITTAADAGANFLNIGYLMNYADTQTLLQRMGDLRQNSSHGNMWIRGFAGKFDSFSGGKLSRFDMDYQGMQIGADKRISVEMPLFIGGYLGTTTGDSNYASGDGTAKASNVGLYTAYMADNGFYLDAIAKYSNIKNNFNVRDTQNEQVRGNGNSNGVSLSLEAGQKFNLTKEDNGFYIEPQAQFSYSHQNAIDINASNGLKVNLGSYESILGRASALFGYELNQGDNKINIYLKTGIVREFEGDVNYQLNGSTESHTFKGNWWNNGVGVSAQVAKQHTFYLDVDSSTGNKFDQRQINGGYRFSF
ncbi:autotransporter outer membrane beta-barrel domain-containing protein [Budvicia aquatica]|uniref:autotransporter outer membrane beta-barrel domain-containing protein n=1 Tax=Budvicia aquatica TaxID=82979 RepID=UPI002087EF86|nr:autotransporter outer membrane beta-barrel domain-containing protein [Budvicia aquatica]GKX53807.1 hypothetical protein SOASR029_41160 [Budvicia aquatica]